MKLLFRILPTFLLLGAAWVLAGRAAPGAKVTQRELDELRTQVRSINLRLDALDAQSHHTLPRGGLS